MIGYCIGGMRRQCPTEYPIGFISAHIDTAVTHLGAKVFVPIRAMKRVTLRREETRPWHAREFIIVGVGEEIAVAHVFGWHFD